MKIILNPNTEIVKEIRQKLKENDNYCPCRIQQTKDTKCMCKEFRDMLTKGIEGECHCGLYLSIKEV